jgi:hypothetical protein
VRRLGFAAAALAAPSRARALVVARALLAARAGVVPRALGGSLAALRAAAAADADAARAELAEAAAGAPSAWGLGVAARRTDAAASAALADALGGGSDAALRRAVARLARTAITGACL